MTSEPGMPHGEPRPERPSGDTGRRRVWLLLSLAALTGLVGFLASHRPFRSHDDWVAAASRALQQQDPITAEQAAQRAIDIEPQSLTAISLAAEAALRRGAPQRAIDYFSRSPADPSTRASRHETAGELLREYGELHRALEQFLQAVNGPPDRDRLTSLPRTTERLAFLYGFAARNLEALPYRLQALQAPDLTPAHLFVVAMGDDFRDDPQRLQAAHLANPTDPLPLLGLARVALTQRQATQARELLEPILESHPDIVEAQVSLGRALLDLDDFDALLSWHRRAAPDWAHHPTFWTVQGDWAQEIGEPRAAVRCFAEAVRRDPNSAESNYRLGQLLVSLGEQELAAPFLLRAERLRDYVNRSYAVVTSGDSASIAWLTDVRRAATAAEALGLLWEAFGWTRLAAAASTDERTADVSSWTEETLKRLEPRLKTAALVRTSPEVNPVRTFPWERYPMFEPRSTGQPRSERDVAPDVDSTIAFRDDARAAGLEFTYFNDGFPLGRSRFLMHEFTGGGGGAIDFDLDGWPDLYLTQGCRWPIEAESTEHLDSLFRNIAGMRFEDVTRQTTLREDRFSQGCTVGDLDNDGFPDLYVANIGSNRLYRNNGDGTFSDFSEAIAGEQPRWTTACVLADLNGDGLPDIYAGNYLDGDDLYSRVCRDIDGSPQACLPQNFSAAADQIFQNRGDGTLIDVSPASGNALGGGKALGVVAADWQETGRLSLFVANDQTPNFFLTAGDDRAQSKFQFVEQGLPSGLALNHQGQMEACMGIAAGDANGDGLLDLFVTNFEHESNTLYLQEAGGLFVDATHAFGLAEPSLPYLGFGTQFVDADADGDLDLMVVNGHIHPSEQAAMPPQLYQNHAGRRFELLPADVVGEYFAVSSLGRGLARLDWNRDGREDLVVSHLNAPVALLTNVSASESHRVSIRLVGVRSSRDAIGASVVLRCGGRQLTQQLVAGAGYLSSNERLLTFGLGAATVVDELQVRWPSGEKQTMRDLPVDREVIIVEGSLPRLLRRFDPPPSP